MGIEMSQFENFTASSLYCDKCKATMPVRERLLLVLPDKELYDYLCTGCASSVGSREVTAGVKKIGGKNSTQKGGPGKGGLNFPPFQQKSGTPFLVLSQNERRPPPRPPTVTGAQSCASSP